MNIQSLFPIPVAEIQERHPTREELSFIKNLKTYPNAGNLTSTDTHVLDREELSDLKTVIKKHVDVFFRDVLKAQPSCSLRITQSWCNYSESDEHHHLHNHPNSAISGVYYPQAEHPMDCINFHTHLGVYHTAVQYITEPNPFTSACFLLPANTGTLFLFPSYLLHSVEPIKERPSTRISLSFNTFYTGSVGFERGLTELKFGEIE